MNATMGCAVITVGFEGAVVNGGQKKREVRGHAMRLKKERSKGRTGGTVKTLHTGHSNKNSALL